MVHLCEFKMHLFAWIHSSTRKTSQYDNVPVYIATEDAPRSFDAGVAWTCVLEGGLDKLRIARLSTADKLFKTAISLYSPELTYSRVYLSPIYGFMVRIICSSKTYESTVAAGNTAARKTMTGLPALSYPDG